MTRWQVPVVLAAVVVGTALGLAFDLGDAPERLVVPALVGLLALTFAGVNGRSFAEGIRPYPKVAAASLGINFLWTPAFAGLLGWLLLSDHPDLRLGLVMLLVTPCTDWYLVFTGTARGNVALAASLLPPNLVLQLVLLPVFVTALTGSAADVPLFELAVSVAVVLGIPLVVAAVVRFLAARADAHDRLDRVLERAQPVGLGLLATAIVAIFATHARVVTDDPDAFVRLLAPLGAFFAVAYLMATGAARTLALRYPERVTLTMTTLARNSPVALAIATVAFPDRPLVAVALVAGPLVELPVLALTANRLTHGHHRKVERQCSL
ncbi:MAG: bile acid:sodium symporter [Acidimicrobiales bacterium]|nr:bile acid:sodium symporter [Acidimicrobiales bacterium]